MSDSESIQFQMDGGEDTESIQFQDAENESLHLGSTTRSLKRANQFAKLSELNSEVDNRSIAFVIEDEGSAVSGGAAARPSGASVATASSAGGNGGAKKNASSSGGSQSPPEGEVNHAAKRRSLHRRETKKFVTKRQSDDDSDHHHHHVDDDQSSVQFVVESVGGGSGVGEDASHRSPSANDQSKKTVVSNTIRQRASSLKGLSARRGSSGASTSHSVVNPPSNSNSHLRVTIELPDEDEGHKALPLRNESESDVVIVASPFPSMSTQQQQFLHFPASSQPSPALAVSAIRHQRTDSNKLVLEHLRDQEASNLFVQHKAAMTLQVTTPTAVSTPTVHERTETDTFPTLMEAVSRVPQGAVAPRSNSNSRSSSPLGPPPVQGTGGNYAAPRRRSQSASSQGSQPQRPPRNGGAPPPPPRGRATQDGYNDIVRSRQHRHADAFASQSLLDELLQTQRFTEEVHRFNATQEKELQRIEQRLETAKLNDSIVARKSSKQCLPPPPPPGALKQAAEELKCLVDVMAQPPPRGSLVKGPKRQGGYATDRKGPSRSPSPNAAVCKVAPPVECVTPPYNAAAAAGRGGKPRVPEAFNKLSTRTAISQQKAEIFASTAKSLGIMWPPSSSRAPAVVVEQLRPDAVSLYFTTGVRLTVHQTQNFFSVVERRFTDNIVQIQSRGKSPPPSPGEAVVGAFSSHATRSPSVPTQTTNCCSSTASRKKRSRTEILRNAFDLLDLRGSGNISKSDLSMLKELMREECNVDLLQRRRKSPLAKQSGGDASLIVTAAVSHAEDRFTFNSFPVPKLVTKSPSSSKVNSQQLQYNPFASYGCRDESGFRKLCEFNHDVILPLLSDSDFEEVEFPYFSMIVLQTLKELSGRTPTAAARNSKEIGSAARFAERIETYFDCLS